MFRTLLIIVAVFGLGWGASFGAGVAFGRRSAPAAQAAAAPGGAQIQVQAGGGAAQAGAQGGPGGAGGQARITAGTIERVEGQTLVLAAGQAGQQTRVTLTGQTQILKQTSGTAEDLSPGTTVMVQAQGQPAADGTLTAATVTVGGALGGLAGGPAGGQALQRQAGGQAGGPGGGAGAGR